MEPLRKLQELLRELFQLEFADLDFGLYRLLHLRRREIEAFLTEQLPRRVEEAFRSVAGEERTGLEREVSELADRIRKDVAEDAVLGSGGIAREYREVKVKAARDLIASYEAKRLQLKSIQVSEAQQAEVFNHLLAFFSRYYEAGDFIPRRRYGARETYAVPYNGEETLFHWANKDQHYVKTAEAFRDYTFIVDALGGPYRVHFVLTEANLPPGNTKGDTRYFFPLPQEATWDKESRTYRLPFHYRLPIEKEVERLGKNSKLQEAVLQDVLEKILKAVPDATLRAALAAIVDRRDEQEISLLLKRLRHFTRRNTTDYFIHRDLEGFLKQELEFYLKDQVLNLGDLEGDLESKRRTLRVIRQLAEEIIIFLAQIEEVEKRLFEKRKFVLRRDYLVPIKEVPRKMWPEVVGNKAQVEAWRSLFAIEPKKDLFNQKGKVNERFLEEHSTLVVDTSHFSEEFKERLVALFDDLDEATGGLLIHAENYQALRFLDRKYADKVKCIYIDPPYNTGSDEFIYKDRYQHSCWTAMMEERLAELRPLMREDGVTFLSIDDHEVATLRLITDKVFGRGSLLAELVWEKTRKNDAKLFSVGHEYMLSIARSSATLAGSGVVWREPKPGAKEIMEEYYRLRGIHGNDDQAAERDLQAWYRQLPEDHPSKRLSRYKHVDGYGVWRDRDISWPGGGGPRYDVPHPVTKKPCKVPEAGWRFATPEAMQEQIRKGLVVFRKDHAEPPIRKAHLLPLPEELDSDSADENQSPNEDNLDEAGMQVMPSVIYKQAQVAVKYLRALFGTKAFENPKDHEVIARLITYCTRNDTDALIFDFFAGSGTTADAVIYANRQDGERRKFILVEMAEYFDSVLLPRIQKVMLVPDWKDGKPKRLPTKEEVERTPRLVKMLRLESYEDALHNLVTEETASAKGQGPQHIRRN
jgi:adenine-specific DNA-methyltransferase